MRKYLTIISLLVSASLGAQTPFAKLTLDKEKVMMEYPDSLLGRTLLLSTKVTNSTSPYIHKLKELSSYELFTVTKVDSTLVLTSSDSHYVIDGSSEALERGVENSNKGAVKSVLKIKKRVGDAYQVDITKLLSPSSKWVVNLKGEDYASYSINNATFNSEKSAIIGCESFNHTIGVKRDVTFDLALRTKLLVVDLDGTEPISMEIFTSLTLLEENDMPHKVADERIGTRTVPFTQFNDQKAMKNDKWAVRWDLREGKNIDVYIDTLLSPAQNRAVREAFEQWNIALAKAGVSGRIRAYDFHKGFRAEDPLASIVTIGSQDTYINADLLSNGADELLAMRFMIPKNYVSSVRRKSVYIISDVDPRYQPYHLGEEAICEVMRADMIRMTGLCLGLTANFAGSYAYTPAQITDPEFTSKYGFTASVTDDVLFNYLARPGDKERGVATIVDKVGEYDIYAMAWLYADGKVSEDPKYFYSPRSTYDPRAIAYDLSNDVIAAFEAGVSHIKYVAEHGAEWLESEDANSESYRDLFIDWLWLRGNNIVFMLSGSVGGYKYNAPRAGSTLPKYEPLSKSFQKACLHREFEFLRDQTWVDRSPLLKLDMANVDATYFTRQNTFTLTAASNRLQHVARAENWAGSDYSVDEFLTDVEDEVFSNIRASKFPDGEMFIVGQYISWLSSRASITNATDLEGISEKCQQYLERAYKELKKHRSSFSGNERRTLDYLIHITEEKLNLKH